VPTKWRQHLRETTKEVIPMVKGFSLLAWLIGKFLGLKGFAIMGIAFELVSKVSGRRQYIVSMPVVRRILP